jgi:hypothetical protein
MGGRVGIGTATPTGILDVSDGTRSYFKVAGTETGGVSILLRNDPIYLSITGNASAGATISGANHVLFTIPVTLDTTNLTLQNGSRVYSRSLSTLVSPTSVARTQTACIKIV